MSGLQRIIINFSYLLTSQVVSALASVGVLAILAKALSPAELGVYALVAAAGAVAIALPAAGLTRVLEREASRHREEAGEILASAQVIRLALGLIFLPLAWLPVLIPSLTLYKDAIFWSVLWIVISPLVMSYSEVAVAFEEMHYELWFNGVYKGTLFLFTLGAGMAGWGLSGVFAAKVAARVAQLVPSIWIVSWRICPVWAKVTKERLRYLLRQGWPLEVSELLQNLFYHLDELILGQVGSLTMVALFHGPLTLVKGISLVPTQMMRASLPSLSRAYSQSWERFHEAFQQGLKYMALVGLPLAASICYFAPSIITLVMGDQYQAAAWPLRLLSVSVLLVFPEIFFRFVLISMGRQTVDTMAVLAGVLVKTGAQFILAWKFGVTGACVAFLLSQVTMVVITSVAAANEIGGSRKSFHGVVKPMMSTGGMVLAFSAAPPWHFSIVMTLGLGFYVGMLVLLGAFTQDEMMLVRSMFRLGK